MQIKLSRLKQIISEVVEEKYAGERMDDIMQSSREEETIEETVEEIDPHDQAIDDMIAEEMEDAMKKFVVGEAPVKDIGLETSDGKNMFIWLNKMTTQTEGRDLFVILENLFQRLLPILSKAKTYADQAGWDTREWQEFVRLAKVLSVIGPEAEAEAGADAGAAAPVNVPQGGTEEEAIKDALKGS